MATKCIVKCSSCQTPAIDDTLFATLLRIADDPTAKCKCGGTRTISLAFDFGLGATDKVSDIEAVFHPRPLESWQDKDGSKVTFFPFLVVLKRTGRHSAIWMPYWHIVESEDGKKKQKYGQWAPYMDASLFESMLQQARQAGFLTDTGS